MKDPNFHRDAKILAYSPDKKILYFVTPKVATRSILRLLREMKKIGEIQFLEIKDRYESHLFKGYYKFSFVRNPWDRVLSAWKQKTDKRYPYFPMLPFKRFLKRIRDYHDHQGLDQHIRPQVHLIDLNDVDFIGRFEDMETGFHKVWSDIGFPRQELPHINKSEHKHYTEYYDDESIELVREIYKNDVIHFKYEYGE